MSYTHLSVFLNIVLLVFIAVTNKGILAPHLEDVVKQTHQQQQQKQPAEQIKEPASSKSSKSCDAEGDTVALRVARKCGLDVSDVKSIVPAVRRLRKTKLPAGSDFIDALGLLVECDSASLLAEGYYKNFPKLSVEYFRSLNPRLRISTEAGSCPDVHEADDAELLLGPLERIKTEGYFHIEEYFSLTEMELVFDAIKNVTAAGLPTVFALLYDELWDIQCRLKPIVTRVLGKDPWHVQGNWVWWVQQGSRGWKPHRDRPGYTQKGKFPLAINTWVAITDATAENGGIYVLPADLDPYYHDHHHDGNFTHNNLPEYYGTAARYNLDEIDGKPLRNAQGQIYDLDLPAVRAVPAKAGSVLGWDETILHWGSVSSPLAPIPRVAMCFQYQSASIPPFSPTLDVSGYIPAWEAKIRHVVNMVQAYSDPNDEFEKMTLDFLHYLKWVQYNRFVDSEPPESPVVCQHVCKRVEGINSTEHPDVFVHGNISGVIATSYQANSEYCSLLLESAQQGGGVTMGYVNTSEPQPISPYIVTMAATAQPFLTHTAHPRVLNLGTGLGSLVQIVRSKHPSAYIDSVDLLPAVIQAAHEFFCAPPPDARTHYHAADAMKWVATAAAGVEAAKATKSKLQDKYNAIFIDVYLGAIIPEPLRKKDFFRQIYTLLEEGGVVVMNMFVSDLDEGKLKTVYDTVTSASEVNSCGDTWFWGMSRGSLDNFILALTKPKKLNKLESVKNLFPPSYFKPVCEDIWESCDEQPPGECAENPLFMFPNCAFTCGLCAVESSSC